MGAACLLALVLTGWAHADSELVVETDRPVIVVVNMKPHPTDGGAVRVTFDETKAGTHNVRIRNLLGEQQWAGTVELPDGQQVTLSWELKNMEVGQPVPLKRELPKLSDQGYSVNDGRIQRGRPPAPAPSPRPPPEEDPFLAVIEQAGSPSPAPAPAPPEPQLTTPAPEEAPASAPAPDLPGGVAEVVFRNRTSTWTNIHVGGELHELRGEREVVVQLPEGAHPVAFRDFRDKETWWEGQVVVSGGERVELQFSRADPPAALDHPDAWKAGE